MGLTTADLQQRNHEAVLVWLFNRSELGNWLGHWLPAIAPGGKLLLCSARIWAELALTLIGTLGFVGGFLGDKLIAVKVGQTRQCSPSAASHLPWDGQQHTSTALTYPPSHQHAFSLRAYSTHRSNSPSWPPLVSRVILSN